ncbi:pyridoxal phosphate-dependent transferase [Talaromyces proteolyticus]|uniref:Pyridoxal phosphate-dependent transferase n=1 Tax=Talaromyces proteolyticus TaxID=1131652 RepID=A0AAD4KWY9_9EURO|nr:pyridoxal phosphate-dependent transferase [Talaromyces proteolyticus]KAH8703060.1 pyridoxal phosphate-dependent transferase [Talaromyces proteolyticus]
MHNIETFELIKWVNDHFPNTLYSFFGSAPVALTLESLVSLSTDPETTTRNLESLNSLSLELPTSFIIRKSIATAIFSDTDGVTTEHVLTTAGSTGGNAVVMQSLLQPGDHVIVQYPTFGQLLAIPKALPGVNVSLWKMDPTKGWDADINELEALVQKGKTKLLVLNNPHNPTGSSLTGKRRRQIVDIAKKYNIWLHVDEIFRPLFYDSEVDSSSFLEFSDEYPQIVVTGSLSKAWALAGLRVGWVVTKERRALRAFHNMAKYLSGECGALDEAIAVEALSSRCRGNILQRQLHQAQTNISILEKFVQRNVPKVAWTKPTSGATAFVQFRKDVDRPVDDIDFCEKLKAVKGVLLVPGSLCFGDGSKETGGQAGQDIKGFVRWHLTGSTEVMEKGITEIEAFLNDGFDRVKAAPQLPHVSRL